MSEQKPASRGDLLSVTTKIVSAYASNNHLGAAQLPQLIQSVFERISALSSDEPTPAELTPAVPVKESVTDGYIVCLEDGRKLRMLKRHLMIAYNMTPEEYRVKWGLKPDYPMVAPAYARKRRELAIKFGLGKKRIASPPEPAPEARRGRSKAGP